MKTAFIIAICIIALFSLGGYIFSPKDEDREEQAKVGAIAGVMWIISILPSVLMIAFIVYCVKSCS